MPEAAHTTWNHPCAIQLEAQNKNPLAEARGF